MGFSRRNQGKKEENKCIPVKDGILFEYKDECTYGCYMDSHLYYNRKTDDYGITLKENGDFVLNSYALGRDDPIRTRLIATDKEMADVVMKRISEISSSIDTIPRSINNGSLDGSFQLFNFHGIRFRALNIMRHDIERIREINPRYYKDYLDIMIYENRLLDAYDVIAEIINARDYVVRLRTTAGDPNHETGLLIDAKDFSYEE